MKLTEALSQLKAKLHEELSPFSQSQKSSSSLQVILRRCPPNLSRFIILSKSMDPLIFCIIGHDPADIEEDCFTLADQTSNSWDIGSLSINNVPSYHPLQHMYQQGLLYASPAGREAAV
jgi:hypothetical protein